MELDAAVYAKASKVAHDVARELAILHAVAKVENLTLTQTCHARARTLARLGPNSKLISNSVEIAKAHAASPRSQPRKKTKSIIATSKKMLTVVPIV